jgi:hypothetical protein
VSDIHGNRTAWEAVPTDLREAAPDLIFHGGDPADGGASPAWTVDRVRDLGWPGMVGNGPRDGSVHSGGSGGNEARMVAQSAA